MNTCENCGKGITNIQALDKTTGDPICPHCGHGGRKMVKAQLTVRIDSSWVCEECGNVSAQLANPGFSPGVGRRPACKECRAPMTCVSACPSKVHGVGTGDEDLELGLALLMEMGKDAKI